jgi:hypothetical protein
MGAVAAKVGAAEDAEPVAEDDIGYGSPPQRGATMLDCGDPKARRRHRFGTGARTDVAHEWIGGRLAAPWYVTQGAPCRVEMIIWLELPDDVIVGTEVVDPKAPVSVAEVLLRTMKKPASGAPRRPARIRVADGGPADEVRAVVPDIDVVVAPTPELHAVLAHMATTMPASDEGESYLENGRVPAAVVAMLFRAAEMLYRLAPWKVASDDQVLRLDIPALGIHGACVSIIGGPGTCRRDALP